MSDEYKFLLNGEWISRDEKIEVRNPYNDELIGYVSKSRKEDVEAAFQSALKGFEEMKKIPAYQRSDILRNTSNIIDKRQEEFARTIALESGKAIKYARGEVKRAIQNLRFSAEEGKRISGEFVPMDISSGSENRVAFYYRVPLGIIVAITPFNFPLNLVVHKVAPAIAAGNSVILKPATYTPISSIKLGEVLLESGLPPEALQILIGSGTEIGGSLVKDSRARMITFTGSLEVGKWIKENAGIKKVTLELGANSACIIEDFSREEFLINRCITGAFANAGQVCISIQRIYVNKKIKDKFLGRFIPAVENILVGEPLNEQVEYSAMISKLEADRAEKWLKEAVDAGAQILTGGMRSRNTFSPTVVTNVTTDMKIVKNEVFAPFVSVIEYDDFEDAIRMANDSIYGLNAGVFVDDVSKAFKAIKGLEVGSVIINDVPTFRVDQMPYGGVKMSGIGREGPKFAIEEMTEIKLAVFNV